MVEGKTGRIADNVVPAVLVDTLCDPEPTGDGIVIPVELDSSFCVAYVEPPFRSFELSERKFGPIECGILESTEPPLNLVESSQRSSLSERVRPFAKTLGLFQLTGAARPLSFFIVSH